MVLQKILEKVFITNKFTRWETSRSLKIDEFEIPYNKNIGKSFSKYELLFLDQAYSSSDPSQILILQFPILRVSLPSSPSLSNFDHTTPQVLNIPYHMQIQANQT